MAIEQVAKSYCAVNEGQGSAINGSYSETCYEGTFEEMCSYADQECAAGGPLWAITATVTRKPGNFAECRVRKQRMDGKQESQMPGSSRDNPQYSLSCIAIPQPILTHKLAESYSGEKLDALKRLVNGGCMGTKIDISKEGQPVTQKTIQSILEGDTSKLIEKLQKGVTSFYSPQVTLQVRYKVKDPGTVTYQKCCTLATPPGPFRSPGGKFDWMSLGTSVEGGGKEWQVTDSYMLSGPDGWDKDIYDQ